MNGRTKRILSIVLTLCMLVSLFPATALGLDAAAQTQSQGTEVVKGSSIPGTGYHVTSVKNYSIAPDISERVIITNNDAGNSQTVANVMEVNTSGGRAKIVAGYGNRNPKEQGWTLKTTTDQAHVYEKESGLNVVGGVNASWFNINTGEPSGYLVMNGVVHHDNSSRAFIAAFDDGSVNVFREGTTLAQAEADQSAKQGKTVKILEAVDALVAMVWDGKVVITESVIPATEYTSVVCRDSCRVISGRMDGSRRASMDLPEPGEPISSTLWPPAAATSKARFTFSWPMTSAKSGRGRDTGEGVQGAMGASPVRWATSWAMFSTG